MAILTGVLLKINRAYNLQKHTYKYIHICRCTSRLIFTVQAKMIPKAREFCFYFVWGRGARLAIVKYELSVVLNF